MGTETETNQQTNNSKMNRKKVVIIVAILVVAIVVVGVGLSLAFSGGKGGTGSLGSSSGISDAKSLQFTVKKTGGSTVPIEYSYYAKNIGGSNLDIRVEYTSSSFNYVYIINGALKKVWVETNGQWLDLSSQYQSQAASWGTTFDDYRTFLLSCGGSGSYTYHSTNGETVQYTNIVANPSLPDSLFTH